MFSAWTFSALEELLPVVIFFAGQQSYGFEVGLLGMVLTTFVLLVVSLLIGRSPPRFALVSTVAVIVFSIPSLVTGNSKYFQLSDTILNGAFAIVLLGSWVLNLPLLKILFSRIFAITDEAWRILSLRWGLLFLFLAVLNEIFRVEYSESFWAQYKLVSTIATIVFGCYQFTLSARLRIPLESNRLGLRT